LEHAGVVWLFREVVLPPGPRRFALRFEAVDYAAEVYWDGAQVGRHRGYFAPFTVELPRSAPGAHLLAVRVDSPDEPASAWSLRKTLIKGVLSHHDTRPGGAWSERGQEHNTGGIWGEVTLLPLAHGWVDGARMDTVSLSAESARVEVSAWVNAVREPGTKLVYRLLDASGAVVAEGLLGRPTPKPRQRFTREIMLSRPRRWLPREQGEPYLYTLAVSLEGPSGADRAQVKVGVRTVERNSRGQLVLNGEPMFLRGTNYIGSLYQAGLDDAALERDLDLMEAAHVNAIRVHAHVASDRFYRLADERGMLVWQDFPLQWGYDDGLAFRREAVAQAHELVDAFGHHPSIVFWSAHNEPPWSSDWMAFKYPDYDPDQNRALDEALEAAFLEVDPRRPAQLQSPPAEHAWQGWYFGRYQDFGKPAAQAVLSEYGAQAVPELATLRTFLKEEELWPLSGKALDTWQHHNFQLKELTEIAKVPVGKDVKELIHNTQAYQARLTQYAAESFRRQKWQPVTGIFQFMFNEHWPSVSWGVVDHLRKPKQGYQALARAYQPLLPMAALHGASKVLRLYVVNDGPAVLGAKVVATVPGRGGPVRFSASVGANERARHVGELPVPEPTQRLELRIEGPDGRVLSENFYEPGYFTP
ncbi:MAG TPA: glycoside hydrolase family 2 TIM barrel-domain containing protein, partial [Myxococcaceae bacterium]|nr:glycoside hydrolase family 2 TIM barrel-domain containing protein [Myxococcaceae bacterium]